MSDPLNFNLPGWVRARSRATTRAGAAAASDQYRRDHPDSKVELLYTAAGGAIGFQLGGVRGALLGLAVGYAYRAMAVPAGAPYPAGVERRIEG